MTFYHGTNTKKIYKLIKKTGFNKGTYFTQYLSSAISYGGKYVFAVELNNIGLIRTQWEYISDVHIPIDKIKYIQKFTLKLKYVNKKLLNNLHMENYKSENKKMCVKCNGHGEHRKGKYLYKYLETPGGGAWKTRKDKVNACKVCNSYGYI